MNSMLKNALMGTLMVSGFASARAELDPSLIDAAEDKLFDQFAFVKEAYVSNDDRFFGGPHEAPMARVPQGYWFQMTQAVALAASNAKTISGQVAAYLAKMPKAVEGASLGGYATIDNAKNIGAKVGVAAVVAAAVYGVYKVATKQTKKEVNCASVRLV